MQALYGLLEPMVSWLVTPWSHFWPQMSPESHPNLSPWTAASWVENYSNQWLYVSFQFLFILSFCSTTAKRLSPRQLLSKETFNWGLVNNLRVSPFTIMVESRQLRALYSFDPQAARMDRQMGWTDKQTLGLAWAFQTSKPASNNTPPNPPKQFIN